MYPSLPSNLNISRDILFGPADTHSYTREDYDLCMAQQPLPGLILPYYMNFKAAAKLGLVPPIVKYGWRIGHVKLMDVIQREFPNRVEYCFEKDDIVKGGRPFWWRDSESDSEDEDEDDSRRPSPSLTLFSNYLLLADICLRAGLPRATRHVDFDYLCDSNGKVEIGLVVGSNHWQIGVLQTEYASKIAEIFGVRMEDARWYLDTVKWHWKPLPPPQKTQSKIVAKKKKVKKAHPQLQATTSAP